MNTDYKHKELTKNIINRFYEVITNLGPVVNKGVSMSQTLLRGKHLITFQEWNKNEINMALDVAGDLKRRFATGEPHRLLQDKTLFIDVF